MKFTFLRKKREDNTLYNPSRRIPSQKEVTTGDSESDQSAFKESKQEIPESQMKLDIKDSKLEPIFKVKRTISNIEKKAIAIPFWRSGVTVISMTFSIFSIIIISFLIYYFYAKLPVEMPLFYNHATNRWGLYNKSVYILLPIFYAAILTILWRIIYLVFFFDKRLALVVTWSVILLSLLAILGLSQILSLVLL